LKNSSASPKSIQVKDFQDPDQVRTIFASLARQGKKTQAQLTPEQLLKFGTLTAEIDDGTGLFLFGFERCPSSSYGQQDKILAVDPVTGEIFFSEHVDRSDILNVWTALWGGKEYESCRSKYASFCLQVLNRKHWTDQNPILIKRIYLLTRGRYSDDNGPVQANMLRALQQDFSENMVIKDCLEDSDDDDYYDYGSYYDEFEDDDCDDDEFVSPVYFQLNSGEILSFALMNALEPGRLVSNIKQKRLLKFLLQKGDSLSAEQILNEQKFVQLLYDAMSQKKGELDFSLVQFNEVEYSEKNVEEFFAAVFPVAKLIVQQPESFDVTVERDFVGISEKFPNFNQNGTFQIANDAYYQHENQTLTYLRKNPSSPNHRPESYSKFTPVGYSFSGGEMIGKIFLREENFKSSPYQVLASLKTISEFYRDWTDAEQQISKQRNSARPLLNGVKTHVDYAPMGNSTAIVFNFSSEGLPLIPPAEIAALHSLITVPTARDLVMGHASRSSIWHHGVLQSFFSRRDVTLALFLAIAEYRRHLTLGTNPEPGLGEFIDWCKSHGKSPLVSPMLAANLKSDLAKLIQTIGSAKSFLVIKNKGLAEVGPEIFDQYLEVMLSVIAAAIRADSNIVSKSRSKTISLSDDLISSQPFTNLTPLVLNCRLQDTFAAAPSHPDILVTVAGQEIANIGEGDLRTEVLVPENNDAIDWFGLHPRVFFKGQEIDSSVAGNFARGGLVEHEGKFYFIRQNALPKLKWLHVFWERLLESRNKKQYGAGKDIDFQAVPMNEVLALLAAELAGIEVTGSPLWARIRDAFQAMESRAHTGHTIAGEAFDPEVASLTVPLRPFQRQGVQWLLDHYNLRVGGVLADDMGLGKTVQALSFLDLVARKSKSAKTLQKPNLVIVPTSLVYNWLSEARKFVPDLKICRLDASEIQALKNRDHRTLSADCYVSTYGLMTEHEELFESIQWGVILFDEAQQLKNIVTNATSVARRLKADIKFALSGTPLENHVRELYSLIDLVASGALGPYNDFVSYYSDKTTQRTALSSDVASRLQFLRSQIRPLILRRTKKLIESELPEKTESTVVLPFDPKQQTIYKNTAVTWNTKISQLLTGKSEKSVQVEMLTALLRLRQICSQPSIVPGIKYDRHSPKLLALLEAIEELQQNGEDVLVFTNFVGMQEALQQALEQRGIRCLSICGKTTAKRRMEILEQFKMSDVPHALLLTMKVGGVGLNLTKARYVFHVEPWWNPAVENQATDRVFRMGQVRSVHVYRYIIEHSLEEKIQQLKAYKQSIFDALMADAEDCDASTESQIQATINAKKDGPALSKDDFRFLLS
jgi:superfamily II DNA or RNA helicase